LRSFGKKGSDARVFYNNTKRDITLASFSPQNSLRQIYRVLNVGDGAVRVGDGTGRESGVVALHAPYHRGHHRERRHPDVNGCFECESVAAILTTMRQQRPSWLVDIGGNIGMYTAAAATQGHRVHTYEPVPTNAARIRETLRRNRLEQRVTLYEACLGPAPGWAALGKNATNQGGIRHELVASGADPGADRHLVPVVSLDTQPPPPADLNVFIKMDIEGSECGALGGAWRFLKNYSNRAAVNFRAWG
jgi:FkbM family methyltransferase